MKISVPSGSLTRAVWRHEGRQLAVAREGLIAETPGVKVRVDSSRCQGHGQCNLLCPEVFQFDEQGFARIENDRVPERLEADVERAVGNCPERAISLEDVRAARTS